MKVTTITHLFFISFFVTSLLSVLSYLNSKRLKSQEFLHLRDFWISLASMSVLSYLVRIYYDVVSPNEYVISLGLLGWLWPLKTMRKILEDMSGSGLYSPAMAIIPIVGGLITIALAGYGFSFRAYTIPFSLSYAIVGGMLISGVYHNKKKSDYSILGHATFTLLGLFFLIRLLYPMWRVDNQLELIGITTHIFILVGLGVSTLSFYIEVMKERHEKELEELIKERNEQLFGQSKYSELGMMSAGIAHEINNPLAIIQAKTTQLIRICRDPQRMREVSDGLEQILITSDRIARTIQGVREFVHQDERIPNEEIPLKKLIEDVLVFCGQRMKNHGINLRFYGLDDVVVRGHKIQLEQVILNLLNNSFDAIEFLSDKWIEISVKENESTIQIFLKDSGTGIPPEVASRMMEPFFTTKNVGKGTGLGLALASGILEKHGGSLEYIQNSRHTTFMIELPKLPMAFQQQRRPNDMASLYS